MFVNQNRHQKTSGVRPQLIGMKLTQLCFINWPGLTRQIVVEGRDKGIAWNKVVIVLLPLGEHLLLLELVQCFAMLDPTLYHRSCVFQHSHVGVHVIEAGNLPVSEG